ncbi:MAG: glucosylglycerol hydrolase [Paracoccaceae bacterium]
MEGAAGPTRADEDAAAAMAEEARRVLQAAPTDHEAGPDDWTEADLDPEVAEVDLRRPDTTNRGYDVVIVGIAAVNPALLESGRPYALVDLAPALHRFPGRPKTLILVEVFGNPDDQRLDGAQDFEWWDADHEVLRHDDDCLR